MKQPVRVTVTGAAGQIGYALLFRIASGAMLGDDQPVILQLLDITPAMEALEGVKMELDDCAFPLLAGIVCTDDPNAGFKDADYALLVGARPRGPGMERKDLLEANAAIFSVQGKAIRRARQPRHQGAGGRQPRQHQRPDHPAQCAVHRPAQLHRHDPPRPQPRHDPDRPENRHHGQRCDQYDHLGQPLGHPVPGPVQLRRSRAQAAIELVEQSWYEEDFIPTVQQRGAAIIKARGASSAASAANAAIDHMRSWALGTEGDDWVSMGVHSDGSYGIAEGLIYSFPCRCSGGEWSIVQGVEVGEFSRARMDATAKELTEERDAVQHLLP